ncbi:MAG TPA: septum site-determining protein MinC [Alphaproteobacteria bacterium]|nr:septum site-determining protein MinC [Alphaproteobacteria bacterium]
MTLSQQVRVDGRSGRSTSAIAPFQIRGRFFTAVVLQMAGEADAKFYEALDTKLAQAPHFFTNAPFVLDLEQARGIGLAGDFIELVRKLRARKLALIGVQNGTIEQNRAAVGAGLITLQGGRDLLPEDEKGGATTAPPATPPSGGALLVTDPVRSGQRVFADEGDLVVVASVGSGAELIARGNIHVYGRMRGRALAGVNGDTKARIFCQSLEAELIAIAGLYRTSDDIDASARKQRVQVFLKDDSLRIEPLK